VIPRRLSHLVSELESGALRIRVKDDDLSQSHRMAAALAHRISASILIGAALIAYVLWAISPASKAWPASWVTVSGAVIGAVTAVSVFYFLLRSRR
jgi:hypothetical protein